MRRKLRKQRAVARHRWFLHKKGIKRLHFLGLLRVRDILKRHHSKDTSFLAHIKREMASSAESYPWKCSGCHRLNKKTMDECPVCYAHWSTGTRHNTEPKTSKKYSQNYTWGDPDADAFWKEETWDYGQDHGRGNAGWKSRSSSRHQATNAPAPRDQSVGAHKGRGGGKTKKGKGKGKGTAPEVSSPFIPQSGKGFTPWTEMDSTGFLPASTNMSSPFQMAQLDTGQQEMAAALRRAYPDPDKVPEDVQAMLDKADKETGRLGLKNLHQAAKHMDRAKKQLKEVNDQKKAHRAMWLKHLTEGIKLWESQLDAYRRHQAILADLATKAQTEITTTSRVIQVLGAAGTGSSLPQLPPPDAADTAAETTEEANAEEEKLRTSLQNVLKACANSLGIASDAPALPQQINSDEEKEDEEKNKKRQRSLEPFPSRP